MIITIRVTDSAIEHIQQETGLDQESAGELAQTLVGLFEIKGTETPKYQQEKKLLRDLRDLIEKHKGDETFDFGVYHDSMSLESSLEQFVSLLEEEDKKREGEGSEDRLFKTADSLMRFYAERGAKVFRARFGSLDILGPCQQIIEEGEGNPHPWPGAE